MYVKVQKTKPRTKKTKTIKTIQPKIIGDIRKPFEPEEEEDYYKPIIIGNFNKNIYIQYESNSDRNKTLSITEYLDEIKPYLKYIIISKNPEHPVNNSN